MTTPSRLLTGLILAISLAVLGCGEEGSGACPGEMNGLYFQLRISNFTSEVFNVTLNGRTMGEVGAYQGVNGAGDTIPGFTNFGEFPVCDGHILDGKGTNSNRLDSKLCSKAPFLQCGGNPNFCFQGFLFCTRIDPVDGCITSDNVPVNYTTPFSAPICGCGPTEPGGPWESC